MAEDYVEAIADLIESDGECRLVRLAERFGVTHVTANRTVGRLQREGLVETQPYAPIGLSQAGWELAREARRRHLIVYRFLLAIGVSPKTAAIDSEGMEHHLSDETLRQFEKFTQQHPPTTEPPAAED